MTTWTRITDDPESLPEDYISTIVTDGHNVPKCEMFVVNGRWHLADGVWCDLEIFTPTHWMPWPEPPGEGE